MPELKCSKCGTIFELPYVRSSDHAAVRKTCPWCNQKYIESRVGPDCPRFGPIQLAQQQVDRDNEPGIGVLIKKPAEGVPKHPARMTEKERAEFKKYRKPRGSSPTTYQRHPPGT